MRIRTKIGQLRVQEEFEGVWRNVYEVEINGEIFYEVEGWTGKSTNCPLREGSSDSKWFVKAETFRGKGE